MNTPNDVLRISSYLQGILDFIDQERQLGSNGNDFGAHQDPDGLLHLTVGGQALVIQTSVLWGPEGSPPTAHSPQETMHFLGSIHDAFVNQYEDRWRTATK